MVVGQTDPDQQEDLTVGLVLSGGGAKGFAHVGVLKVLEEQGLVSASGKTIVVYGARPNRKL